MNRQNMSALTRWARGAVAVAILVLAILGLGALVVALDGGGTSDDAELLEARKTLSQTFDVTARASLETRIATLEAAATARAK